MKRDVKIWKAPDKRSYKMDQFFVLNSQRLSKLRKRDLDLEICLNDSKIYLCTIHEWMNAYRNGLSHWLKEDTESLLNYLVQSLKSLYELSYKLNHHLEIHPEDEASLSSIDHSIKIEICNIKNISISSNS